MNDLLFLVIGVVAGAYFAEPIRETVPALNPNSTTKPKS